MATESVATPVLGVDALWHVKSLVREAIALQEMAIRVREENMEDFAMLQSACGVTHRLLEKAAHILGTGKDNDD